MCPTNKSSYVLSPYTHTTWMGSCAGCYTRCDSVGKKERKKKEEEEERKKKEERRKKDQRFPPIIKDSHSKPVTVSS